jgi:hypothetical protein
MHFRQLIVVYKAEDNKRVSVLKNTVKTNLQHFYNSAEMVQGVAGPIVQ